jgi:hypothetical protein
MLVALRCQKFEECFRVARTKLRVTARVAREVIFEADVSSGY